MEHNENISKLLRLKRYERPPPGYFDDFLREFQRRQRAELLRQPVWEVWWERLMSLAPTFRVPQLAYAAIVALAVSASVLILNQQPHNAGAIAKADSDSQAFSLTSSKPVTISDTLPVSARTGGPVSSHYVLPSRPVSNEQPLSF